MDYRAPYGSPDPNASYVDKDVPGAVAGSKVPAKAVENPQRELVALIEAAGFTPDVAVLDQVAQAIRSQRMNYAVAGGTANALTVTLTPAPLAYTLGLPLQVRIASANTGVPTLNVNGLGAKTIKRRDGSALAAGDLKADGIYSLIYDGTDFRVGGFLQSDIDRRATSYALLAHTEAGGTHGGAVAVANTWFTRKLNTKLFDPQGIVTGPTSNQFTLQAGRYLVRANVNGFATNRTVGRLYSITDAVVSAYGTVGNSRDPTIDSGQDAVVTSSLIDAELNLAAAKTFRLEQIADVAGGAQPWASWQLGFGAHLSNPEIFTTIFIQKVSD